MIQGVRKDIQGLRAIAVLSVIIFHASGGTVLPGGFAGVDIFFVISGFLITGVLLRASQHGRFSLLDFYRRRCRRILPALLVMVAATLAVGALLLSPADYAAAARSAVAALLFVANILFQKQNGYFDQASELKPLLHTWSLSVEEQFYLVFPLGLWTILRFAPSRLELLIALGALGSLALSVWAVEARPGFAFYGMPGRGFELGLGALLALRVPAVAALPHHRRDLLSLAGLAAIAASFFLFSAGSAWPGLLALLPCLGVVAVISAGGPGETIAGRLLAWPPVQAVGTLSYSLYLWHWPVLVFATHLTFAPLTPWQTALAMAATLILAWASWRWVEQPFLKGAPRGGILRTSALATAALAGGAALIVVSDGAPQRFDALTLAAFDARSDHNPRRVPCHYVGGQASYDQTCVFGAAGGRATVAVWSDSHGSELVVALGETLALRGEAARQISASSCPPGVRPIAVVRPYCAAYNRTMLAGLLADPRIETVVLVAYYTGYGDPAELATNVADTAGRLRANGKRVVVVEPLPVQGFDPPTAAGALIARGAAAEDWGQPLDAHRRANQAATAILRDRLALGNIALVDPLPALCTDVRCPLWDNDRRVLYFDKSHLSLTAARRLVPLVLAQHGAPSLPVNRRSLGP